MEKKRKTSWLALPQREIMQQHITFQIEIKIKETMKKSGMSTKLQSRQEWRKWRVYRHKPKLTSETKKKKKEQDRTKNQHIKRRLK